MKEVIIAILITFIATLFLTVTLQLDAGYRPVYQTEDYLWLEYENEPYLLVPMNQPPPQSGDTGEEG